MAINDTRIDLTEDSKFSKGSRVDLFDHVKPVSFPWNKGQLTSDTPMVETRCVRPWVIQFLAKAIHVKGDFYGMYMV